MNRSKLKKSKPEWKDDGRTVADMNVEGMRWYRPEKSPADSSVQERATRQQPADRALQLTKKERRAIFLAALGLALKLAFTVLGALFLLLLLLRLFWLH